MRLSELASALVGSALALSFAAFGCAGATDDVGTTGGAATSSHASLDASALGTWRLGGSGSTTGTILVSSVAPFRFSVSLADVRTLHTGDIADAEATVSGKVATFTDDGCKLALHFGGDALTVTQTGECSGYFGAGIRATGTYEKASPDAGADEEDAGSP